MNRNIKSILILLLVAVMLLGACGCESNTAKRPPLNTDFTPKESSFSFSAAPSEELQLSREGAAAVLEAVEQVQTVYPYADLYQLDEVKKRLSFDASVLSHQFCALNADGKLESAHLAALVKENNEAFMATKPFGYKPVEEDYIDELCDFIVTVIDAMSQKYPDVNWKRVYCNLGRLKILYDTGMLSYAQVNPEMILSISQNNTNIILTMKGADGFSRVMTHEIMHIIQLGCSCEHIENCSRRAGIALYWDDFTLNTTDWTWMAEGSAERHMCKLTGGEAVTYQYKMDYLCSMTMSVLLREDVKADTMETLCFYDDPQLLFNAFGCETEAQREELLNMMITLQVLQIQPKSFHIVYAEKTGIDLKEDADAMDRFSYSLKPAACITMAKEFYENLTLFLQENALACNDLFFLINLFEGHINQHLSFSAASKAEVNQPFMTAYNALRSALFEALEQENPGLDLEALYNSYEITTGENLLNAQLSMLPPEKQAFLAERAQWQSELMGLGVKVSQ